MEELDPVKVPPEVKDNIPDGKVFVIFKGNKTIGYIAPNEYYNFERFLNTAINGYLDEVNESYKKAERNPSDFSIIYSKDGKMTFRRKVVPRPKLFKTVDADKPGLFRKKHTPQDTYSADKQMKKLKKDLQIYGVQETKDDDSDDE